MKVDVATISRVSLCHEQEIEEALYRSSGYAAVLSRLFELYQAHATPEAHCVDFGGERDEEFWNGLRIMTRCVSEDLETIKGSTEYLEVP